MNYKDAYPFVNFAMDFSFDAVMLVTCSWQICDNSDLKVGAGPYSKCGQCDFKSLANNFCDLVGWAVFL